MELHLLPIFICLILVPVVISASLPPELYWKSKLPNTTMPKAIKDLLSAGNMVKAIYDDPKKATFTWQRNFTNKLRDDPNKAYVYLHNDPNRKSIYGSTDQLHDDPNKAYVYLHNDPNRKSIYGSTDELHDDPNKAYVSYVYLHNDPNRQRTATDQSLDDSTKFLFLSENDLHPGKKLDMLFTKSPYSMVLIPREVADTIPFSLEKLPEILKMFFVEPMSKEAQIIKRAIHLCEEPPRTKGEEKHCATSLESMIDYITSKLGKNVKAYSTEVEKETQLQTYAMAPGVKKISDEVMVCHQAHYPYVLFRCHRVGGPTRAYFVPLEGSDGTRVKAIVVCHLDTSDWDADNIAFRTLKIKPGTAPVCHFSPPDNVIWTPRMAA